MSAQAKRLFRPATRPDFSQLRTQSERGASAVEFAIVIVLLFMLVFGIIQFGMAYHRFQGLQAAAREGARAASIGASEAEIRGRVRVAQEMFVPTDVLVSIDYSDNDGASFPGGNKICDDASGGNRCTDEGNPSPCQVAGLGNLIRVKATVPGAGGKYAIVIPLWGNANITYTSVGVFRCDSFQ